MKVVVTGGSGQLGTVLLRRLLRDRTVKQIISIDLRPPALPGHKLKYVRADVRDSDIGQHFTGCDALFHLAFVVTHYLPRPEVDSINIEGSKNIFRAAAAAGLKQVIYSSSIAAYGVVPGHKLPLTEDAPRIHQPDFAYSATKWQVEEFLDEFERAHPDIAVTRLRPSILLGRTMDHQLGVMLRSRTLFSISDKPMPIVWDEDVADAAMLALRKQARGAFNLCADNLLSPADLSREGGLRNIHLGPSALKVLAKIDPLLRPLRKGREQDPAWIKNAGVGMVASSLRAREVLGWKPRFPTAKAIIRHYVESVPRKLDLRLATFFRGVAMSAKKMPPDVQLQGMDSRIHLQITGPGGGDLGIIVDSCRVHIEKEAPRPPTAVLRIADQTLIDLLAGRTDLGAAQLTGKVQIDGEPRAAMLLGAILARFKQSTQLPGVPGFFARGMAAWFRRGGPAKSATESTTESTTATEEKEESSR